MGDKLLKEDGGGLLQETSDYILLDGLIYRMVTAPASFAYTPQTSGDPVIRNLPTAPATFVLTGMASGFKRIMTMVTAPATFVLTGMTSGTKLVIHKIKSLGVRIVNSFFSNRINAKNISNRIDTTKINTRTQDL